MSRRPPPSVRRTIIFAWAALLLLLALTAGLAFLPLGMFSLPVSLLIAVAKVAIVMALFMELRHASAIVRTAAFAGFFWLSILMTLVAADYGVRMERHLPERPASTGQRD